MGGGGGGGGRGRGGGGATARRCARGWDDGVLCTPLWQSQNAFRHGPYNYIGPCFLLRHRVIRPELFSPRAILTVSHRHQCRARWEVSSLQVQGTTLVVWVVISRSCPSWAKKHSHPGAVRESRGPSWAVRPNEPSGFRGRKAIVNHASALVSACP